MKPRLTKDEVLFKGQVEIAIDRLGFVGVLHVLTEVAARRSKKDQAVIAREGLRDYYGKVVEVLVKLRETLGELSSDNARWKRKNREIVEAGRSLRGPRLT